MPPENLRKFRVSNHADRSWHRCWATLEMAGTRYDAVEPEYLKTERWQESRWQLPPDHADPVRIKTWLDIAETGASDFEAAGRVRITLRFQQASFPKAVVWKYLFNYIEVIRRVPSGRYVYSSVFLVSMNIPGQVLSASLIAFAFSRLRWRPSRFPPS